MSKFNIYVVEKSYSDYSQEHAVVEAAGGRLGFARCRDEDDVVEQCRDAHGLLLRQTRVGERTFRALKNLRVVARYGVGFDNVDVDAATRWGVLVTVVPDYCIAEVAEHTIALMLAAVRHIPIRDRMVRNGAWDLSSQYTSHRMDNRIYGLVGYGKTAREVRRRLSGFPLRFVACDPDVPERCFLEDGTRRMDFRKLVLVSHYISVHVPLNADTHHLFDLSVFRRMRRSALLVNTSRGPVVDARGLADAIERGHIAGAALDVFEAEPPGWSSPLRDLDSVILSDHAAWYSEESQRELQLRTAQEAVRVLRGRKPQHPVNTEALHRDVSRVKCEAGRSL
jgi:D-3-phosphoglycerate dehydrogenase